jgi:hypothetical protein
VSAMDTGLTPTSSTSAPAVRRTSPLEMLKRDPLYPRAKAYCKRGYTAERVAEITGMALTECRLLKANV